MVSTGEPLTTGACLGVDDSPPAPCTSLCLAVNVPCQFQAVVVLAIIDERARHEDRSMGQLISSKNSQVCGRIIETAEWHATQCAHFG